MRVLDASSLVFAWDNYPIANLPTLWAWVDSEFSLRNIVLPRVAFEEVGHVSPDCKLWVTDISNFSPIDVDNSIVAGALTINASLGIRNDQYGSGVDANDVIIIATAMSFSCDLITNEHRQPSLPANIKNYKIPATCNLPNVRVNCISFADLIRSSGRIF